MRIIGGANANTQRSTASAKTETSGLGEQSLDQDEIRELQEAVQGISRFEINLASQDVLGSELDSYTGTVRNRINNAQEAEALNALSGSASPSHAQKASGEVAQPTEAEQAQIDKEKAEKDELEKMKKLLQLMKHFTMYLSMGSTFRDGREIETFLKKNLIPIGGTTLEDIMDKATGLPNAEVAQSYIEVDRGPRFPS